MANNISIRSPLIYSKPLSDIISRDVYLKLENTQPSGSFKLRGLSHLIKQKASEGFTKFVGSSGGNAGLALAYTANKMGLDCEIFVPQFVVPRMLEKLKSYGATIKIIGKDWQEANDAALKTIDSKTAFVHPYDHHLIWEGHSLIVDEIIQDSGPPSCIVVSVGGGGLLMGILTGLERNGLKKTKVLAMETIGSECFHKSMEEDRHVEIELKSIAKTLGARSVHKTLFERYKEFNVISHVLSDKQAVEGCLKFSDDHGFLVEPSCGVTIASVYSQLNALQPNGDDGPIVLIVCGGSDVSLEILEGFKQQFHI